MDERKPDEMVFRQLSEDMRDGLKNIYRQISNASVPEQAAIPSDALFSEASDQLGEVIKDTESAAMRIMEIVEKNLELTQEGEILLARLEEKHVKSPELDRLRAINAQREADLTTVLTTLSFQDITGQRIKKVVETLHLIENSVVELYLSSGLVLDGAKKDPARDGETLRAEARQAVEEFRQTRKSGTELKGPDKNGVSQNAIDDMLAQLGF